MPFPVSPANRDEVTTGKRFSRHWSFGRGIHQLMGLRYTLELFIARLTQMYEFFVIV